MRGKLCVQLLLLLASGALLAQLPGHQREVFFRPGSRAPEGAELLLCLL